MDDHVENDRIWEARSQYDTAHRNDWPEGNDMFSRYIGQHVHQDFWERELECQLRGWRESINCKISQVGVMLPSFKALRELSIEVTSLRNPTVTPRWNYLSDNSIGQIITGLPVNLVNLTLDTYASGFVRNTNLVRPKTLLSPTRACTNLKM